MNIHEFAVFFLFYYLLRVTLLLTLLIVFVKHNFALIYLLLHATMLVLLFGIRELFPDFVARLYRKSKILYGVRPFVGASTAISLLVMGSLIYEYGNDKPSLMVFFVLLGVLDVCLLAMVADVSGPSGFIETHIKFPPVFKRTASHKVPLSKPVPKAASVAPKPAVKESHPSTIFNSSW